MRSSSGWLSTPRKQARRRPGSFSGPSFPGRNFSQTQMIATAKKGIVDEAADAVGEAAVGSERIASNRARDEAVDVGQVRRDDQRRHRARAEALEPHPAKHRADQAVGEIVYRLRPVIATPAVSRGKQSSAALDCRLRHRLPRNDPTVVRTQSWCGSFSTCQVWPLATSAWRSGVLPDAAALFCSMTTLSKVGAGFS